MTHLKLFVQCCRGEGTMICPLQWTVRRLIEEVLSTYDFDPDPGDRFVLHHGDTTKAPVLQDEWKLWESGLRPGDHVWLEVL